MPGSAEEIFPRGPTVGRKPGGGGPQAPFDGTLSVCIVTYRARDFLRECIHSIYARTSTLCPEIIVVDNCSQDGTVEMLRVDFPNVHLILNDRNAGFSAPANQAIRASHGQFILLLNNDTRVLPGALDRLVEFVAGHPEIGICGPKVLNRDGTFQQQCRRGLAHPWDLFCYFSGLSRAFPKSRRFARYLLTYLDENAANPVDAVSGSCMLIRRQVIDQIGLLDERFFAYQEDADYSLRAKQAGWQVYYYPEAQIIHYAGEGGSRINPWKSIYEWHKSYWLYYRKNLAGGYPLLFNGFYYLVMLLKLASALLINLFRREKYAGSKKP